MKIFITVDISFPPRMVPVGNLDTVLLRPPSTVMMYLAESHTSGEVWVSEFIQEMCSHA